MIKKIYFNSKITEIENKIRSDTVLVTNVALDTKATHMKNSDKSYSE